VETGWAGIYTNTQGSGSTIRENIIINAIGNKYGFWTSRAFAAGIYPDEFCEHVTMEYNTVVNTGEAGIKMHNNRTSIVRYNNIVDSRTTINVLGRTDGVGTEKIDINNNTLIQNSTVDSEYLATNLFIWSGNSPASGSGSPQYTSNNNKLVYPGTTSSSDMFKKDSPYYTFSEWQAAGYDTASTLNQTALGGGETYQCFYNESQVTKNYSVTGTNVKNIDQNTVSSFSLAPYRSIMLRGSSIVVTEV
jgi:hypothetical protein